MHDLLTRLAGRGVGILLCTHLLDDVERLCSRACIIAEGRTVAEGGIEDLLRDHNGQVRFRLELSGPAPDVAPTHVRVLVREPGSVVVEVNPGVRPDAAWRELLSSGWPVTTITHEGGGLEQVYLDAVGPGGLPGVAGQGQPRRVA